MNTRAPRSLPRWIRIAATMATPPVGTQLPPVVPGTLMLPRKVVIVTHGRNVPTTATVHAANALWIVVMLLSLVRLAPLCNGPRQDARSRVAGTTTAPLVQLCLPPEVVQPGPLGIARWGDKKGAAGS